MIIRLPVTNSLCLSPAGGSAGLEFHDANIGVAAFHQYGGIRLVDGTVKQDLINNHAHERVIYLLGIRSSRNLQDILNDVQMALTDAGDFGEWDLLPDQTTRHGTGRQQPVLYWLRLRSTKVGHSMDWVRFFQKMEVLQGRFGFAQFGTLYPFVLGRPAGMRKDVASPSTTLLRIPSDRSSMGDNSEVPRGLFILSSRIGTLQGSGLT